MKNFASGICAVLAIFASCSTPSVTKKTCLNDRTKESAISWGEYSTKTGQMRAYQFNGALVFTKFLRESETDTNTYTKIGDISTDDFCKYLTTALRTFDTVQTLHAPGDIGRFVEYSNKETTTRIRAVWNPEYKTYGSKAFRSVYDSLMTMVPPEQRW